jgi:hypothetical protein
LDGTRKMPYAFTEQGVAMFRKSSNEKDLSITKIIQNDREKEIIEDLLRLLEIFIRTKRNFHIIF